MVFPLSTDLGFSPKGDLRQRPISLAKLLPCPFSAPSLFSHSLVIFCKQESGWSGVCAHLLIFLFMYPFQTQYKLPSLCCCHFPSRPVLPSSSFFSQTVWALSTFRPPSFPPRFPMRSVHLFFFPCLVPLPKQVPVMASFFSFSYAYVMTAFPSLLLVSFFFENSS